MNRPRVIRAILSCLGFMALVCAYAYLPLSRAPKPPSPDELANRFFAEEQATNARLWRWESLDEVAPGLVHPRSMRVVDDFLVPGSFIGMPFLYGNAAAAIGQKWIIPYITPVLAAGAAFLWGAFVAGLYGPLVGVAAAFLFALHPAWWYAASRTMLPNAAFMAFLIAALAVFTRSPLQAAFMAYKGRTRLLEYVDPAVAGMFLGLALATRTSEAIWIAVAVLMATLIPEWKFPWKKVAIAAGVAGLTLVPFFIMNASIYGGWLASGYGDNGMHVVYEQHLRRSSKLLRPVLPYLFPLGFSPRNALAHFAKYGLGFFWGWTVIVAVAAAVLARARRLRGETIWPRNGIAWLSFVVSVWLILFYGSWVIVDAPDPSAVTIGSSYIRYWLPIFALSTIPVALAFVRGAEKLRVSRRAKIAGSAALAIVYVTACAMTVFFSRAEGLAVMRRTLDAHDATAKRVFSLTPANAVIVVDRADKLLFPERKVIQPLRNDDVQRALPALAAVGPLYYFGITIPESDLEWFRREKLAPLGLDIEFVATIGEETLYRFLKRP